MRWIPVGVLTVHGLIHLMGFLEAFGFHHFPQLTQPISRPMGLAWLAATLLVLATVVLWVAAGKAWWVIGAVACTVSQVLIISAWRDAHVGTVANLLLAVVVVYGFLTHGPGSYRAEFERDIATYGARTPAPGPIVTEADLERVPEAVRRYLRVTGMVGQPRISRYHYRYRGRIRGSATKPWMSTDTEQFSVADGPHRLFFMDATMLGIPLQAYHRLTGGHATMRVKAGGLVTVVDAKGRDMDQAESVTLLNDMCLLAPSTLLDPHLRWQPVDDRTVHVGFTHGAHDVSATLLFDAEGRIVDFVSDDRLALSPDGKTQIRQRFSTPVLAYRQFGPYTLASRIDAKWHPPEGAYVYAEFEVVSMSFDGR